MILVYSKGSEVMAWVVLLDLLVSVLVPQGT